MKGTEERVGVSSYSVLTDFKVVKFILLLTLHNSVCFCLIQRGDHLLCDSCVCTCPSTVAVWRNRSEFMMFSHRNVCLKESLQCTLLPVDLRSCGM